MLCLLPSLPGCAAVHGRARQAPGPGQCYRRASTLTRNLKFQVGPEATVTGCHGSLNLAYDGCWYIAQHGPLRQDIIEAITQQGPLGPPCDIIQPRISRNKVRSDHNMARNQGTRRPCRRRRSRPAARPHALARAAAAACASVRARLERHCSRTRTRTHAQTRTHNRVPAPPHAHGRAGGGAPPAARFPDSRRPRLQSPAPHVP